MPATRGAHPTLVDVIPVILMKTNSEAPCAVISFSLLFLTFSQEQYSFLHLILKLPPSA